MIYFTSDLHFGHKNVIEYCQRPWLTIEEMHDGIIKIWNEQVTPDDEVYVIGDFSLNPKWSGSMLPLLNGTKHLILGNHDAPFPNKLGATSLKTQNMRGRYYRDGWKTLTLNHTMQLKNGLTVLLSHFPYWSSGYDNRYKEHRPEDTGGVLIHGHLHGRYRKFGRCIDVGLDGDLKLFSEDEVIALINDPRDFIPTPLTEYYRHRVNKYDVS